MPPRGRRPKTPALGAFALREELEHSPGRAYLLLGAERFLQGIALDSLREVLLGDNPGPALQEFDGRKTELAPVLDELRTLPFIGTTHRLVVVTDVGQQGGFCAKHGEALAKFLQTPIQTSTLVLTAEKLDGRLKSTKTVKKAVKIVDCSPPDEASLLAFVRARAKLWGRSFARRADMALLEQLGGQDMALTTLDSEVHKLASAGEGPITADEVIALCSVGSSEQAFGLIDRMGAGEVEGALLLLQRIFRDGLITAGGDRTRDATGIGMILLPTLRWDLGRLLKAQPMLERGCSRSDVTREVRVFRDKEHFMARVRRADRAELGRRHRILRRADVELRGSGDPLTLLTRVVVQLALAERPDAVRC